MAWLSIPGLVPEEGSNSYYWTPTITMIAAMLTLSCTSAAQHASQRPHQFVYTEPASVYMHGQHAHVQPAQLHAVFTQQGTYPMMLIQQTAFMQPLYHQQHAAVQRTFLSQPYQQQFQFYQHHSSPLYAAHQQQYYFTNPPKQLHAEPALYGTVNNHKVSTGSAHQKQFVPYNYANTVEENEFYARTGDAHSAAGLPYDPTAHGDPAFSFYNQ